MKVGLVNGDGKNKLCRLGICIQFEEISFLLIDAKGQNMSSFARDFPSFMFFYWWNFYKYHSAWVDFHYILSSQDCV